jgi:hypothetical protein
VDAWFSQGITSTSGLISAPVFYTKPWALDSIINLDNTTRQLVPHAEIQSALADVSAPFRAEIKVPLQLVQADHDGLFVPQNGTALFPAHRMYRSSCSTRPDIRHSYIQLARHQPSRPSHAGSSSASSSKPPFDEHSRSSCLTDQRHESVLLQILVGRTFEHAEHPLVLHIAALVSAALGSRLCVRLAGFQKSAYTSDLL